MEFRLLGPFEASHAHSAVPVGRRQERLVLTMLLLAGPDRVVPADRLVDRLWPLRGPGNARGTLHTYVGRLRRALAPYGLTLEHVGDGYRLAGRYELDVREFRRLAGTRTTDPHERARHYTEALALWRGDLDDPALRALRQDTMERLVRLLLDAGRHDDAVAQLAGADPTRERLTAYLMTALVRGGRRGDALELFTRARQALRELGLTPGPDLLALRARIIRDDPALIRPPQPRYAVQVRDQWLPWLTGGHPALEFCNTYAGWGSPPTPHSDWLRGYPTLAVWAGHLDLADDWIVTRLLHVAGRDPAAAAAVLAEARELRARVYASLTDPDDPVAFKAVAAVADRAARAATFVRGPDGLGRWRIAPGAGLRLPLLAAALSAADLLADPRRLAVRACPGPSCGWLFLDEGGRRRWCSLGTCGSCAPG